MKRALVSRSYLEKALSGESVVGGISVWILPGGDNILATIFVDPKFQDMGVGEQTRR